MPGLGSDDPSIEDDCRHHWLGYSYVVLRPSLDVALARATSRGRAALKNVEPIKGLYRAFENLGELEACVIDSSAMTIAETAAAVVERLR